jgi:hypothetical protein
MSLIGSYQIAVPTGTMAAGLAGASPIFSARWGSTTKWAQIRRIALSMISLGTGFTAGTGMFESVPARAFTASDTGGTPVTLTGDNAKLLTAYATSIFTDMRISSTATLSAGTRTLDAQASSVVVFGVSTATNAIQLATTELRATHDVPRVLKQDEGFIIRATVPATGTWQAVVTIGWDEMDSYSPI